MLKEEERIFESIAEKKGIKTSLASMIIFIWILTLLGEVFLTKKT